MCGRFGHSKSLAILILGKFRQLYRGSEFDLVEDARDARIGDPVALGPRQTQQGFELGARQSAQEQSMAQIIETIEDRFAATPGARPAGGGVRDLLQRQKRVQWRHCLSGAGPLDRPVTIQFARKGTFIGTVGGPFPARDRRLPDQACP